METLHRPAPHPSIFSAEINTSCAPVLVGDTAAVIADQVAEDENGGDGLF
jgi:hypothetical protein